MNKLKISRAAKKLRRLKRVRSLAFDRLQVMKYISTRSDVISRALLAACLPCVSPPEHHGADALVLWLIFEERLDFQRFESTADPHVNDWWPELVLAAHALPVAEVQPYTIVCGAQRPSAPFRRLAFLYYPAITLQICVAFSKLGSAACRLHRPPPPLHAGDPWWQVCACG